MPLIASALLLAGGLGCAVPAKVTSVVNTDPATRYTQQTTIVEYKSWDVQLMDTVAQWVVKGAKYVGGMVAP